MTGVLSLRADKSGARSLRSLTPQRQQAALPGPKRASVRDDAFHLYFSNLRMLHPKTARRCYLIPLRVPAEEAVLFPLRARIRIGDVDHQRAIDVLELPG